MNVLNSDLNCSGGSFMFLLQFTDQYYNVVVVYLGNSGLLDAALLGQAHKCLGAPTKFDSGGALKLILPISRHLDVSRAAIWIQIQRTVPASPSCLRCSRDLLKVCLRSSPPGVMAISTSTRKDTR